MRDPLLLAVAAMSMLDPVFAADAASPECRLSC